MRHEMTATRSALLHLVLGAAVGLALGIGFGLFDPSGLAPWAALLLAGIGAISLGIGWAVGAVASRLSPCTGTRVGAVVRIVATAVPAGLAAEAMLREISAIQPLPIVAAFVLAAVAAAILVARAAARQPGCRVAV